MDDYSENGIEEKSNAVYALNTISNSIDFPPGAERYHVQEIVNAVRTMARQKRLLEDLFEQYKESVEYALGTGQVRCNMADNPWRSATYPPDTVRSVLFTDDGIDFYVGFYNGEWYAFDYLGGSDGAGRQITFWMEIPVKQLREIM